MTKMKCMGGIAAGLVGLVLGLSGGQPVAAQEPTPAAIEGPIESIVGGATRTLTVAGVPIILAPGVTISSPTTTRPGSQGLVAWFAGNPFPGRSQAGFIGGTAIGDGTVDATNRFVATSVFSEPAENGLVGVVTASSCATANCQGPGDFLRVQGVAAIPILDPTVPARIVARPPVNGFGFEVDLAGRNLVGEPIGIEGYYGNINGFPVAAPTEKAFHYFLVEFASEDPDLMLNKAIDEVVATRAQCTTGGGLEIRGANHARVTGPSNTPVGNPAGGLIRIIQRGTPNVVLGETTDLTAILPVVGTAVFATWRIRIPVGGACPSEVDVVWRRAGAQVARANRVAVDIIR